MSYKPYYKDANGSLVELPLVAEKLGTKTIGSTKEPIYLKDGSPQGFNVVDLIYPVGSIYMSVNETSPQTLFGGIWEQLKDRFLLGAGATYSAGQTGGSATHTLGVNELPSHTHGISITTSENGSHTHTRGSMNITGSANDALGSWGHDGGSSNMTVSGALTLGGKTGECGSAGSTIKKFQLGLDASQGWTGETSSNGSHTHSVSGNSGATGSSAAHNNMPPYIVVYMWKRTA